MCQSATHIDIIQRRPSRGRAIELPALSIGRASLEDTYLELVARYDVSLGTYRLLFASGGTLTEITEESS